MANAYDEAWRAAKADPEKFWADAAAGIEWFRPWDRVLDDRRRPFTRWFSGALTNTCHNALDRHVATRGDQIALIYDSPVTKTIRRFTYRELRDRVAKFAGALAALGVGKGDRVIIYMPMVPEAVVGMLACARLGAIHSVVFGGFASNELATRIDDARPSVILTATCGIEIDRVIPYGPLLEGALAIAKHRPAKIVVLQRPEHRADLVAGRDLDWSAVENAAAAHDCVPVEATALTISPRVTEVVTGADMWLPCRE